MTSQSPFLIVLLYNFFFKENDYNKISLSFQPRITCFYLLFSPISSLYYDMLCQACLSEQQNPKGVELKKRLNFNLYGSPSGPLLDSESKVLVVKYTFTYNFLSIDHHRRSMRSTPVLPSSSVSSLANAPVLHRYDL